MCRRWGESPPRERWSSDRTGSLSYAGHQPYTPGFERVVEIILDAVTRWKGAPEKVWNYTLGGYHIVKKCPKYREQSLLHGPLTGKEAQQFTDPARRIATLLQQNPELDAHYRASSGVIV